MHKPSEFLDYVHMDLSIPFNENTQEGCIYISIIADNVLEGDEIFSITILGGVGVKALTSTATGRILDKDGK